MTIEEIMAELAEIERIAKEMGFGLAGAEFTMRQRVEKFSAYLWLGARAEFVHESAATPEAALAGLRDKLSVRNAFRTAEGASLKSRLAELGEA